MQIKFIQPWRRFAPGDLWSPGAGVADLLIKRGKAIKHEVKQVESAAFAGPKLKPKPARKNRMMKQ